MPRTPGFRPRLIHAPKILATSTVVTPLDTPTTLIATYNAGNQVGARALAEEILTEDETNVTALKLRAQMLIDADQPADAIVDLVYALAAQYRANATFIMNSKTAGAVRKMKDSDGRFLWAESLAAGQPARLMGYRVMICEDMPDIANDSYSIAFGDFSAGYTVAERPDLRVLRDPFSAKPHVLFYATKRVGGDVSDFAAIKLLRFAVS